MGREVVEGLQEVGVDEVIQWRITCNPPPVSVQALTVVDESSSFAVVTGSTLPAGADTGTGTSIQGSQIVLPPMGGLTRNHTYRVEVRYTDGINTLEPYFRVVCRR
jgi:hypothetical protein